MAPAGIPMRSSSSNDAKLVRIWFGCGLDTVSSWITIAPSLSAATSELLPLISNIFQKQHNNLSERNEEDVYSTQYFITVLQAGSTTELTARRSSLASKMEQLMMFWISRSVFESTSRLVERFALCSLDRIVAEIPGTRLSGREAILCSVRSLWFCLFFDAKTKSQRAIESISRNFQEKKLITKNKAFPIGSRTNVLLKKDH